MQRSNRRSTPRRVWKKKAEKSGRVPFVEFNKQKWTRLLYRGRNVARLPSRSQRWTRPHTSQTTACFTLLNYRSRTDPGQI